eukprot:TRINITY_DN13580_c0_g1_i1.p1 TRINITY_DN13580_c0_g1~~TRINITY_DN13580_c0_g1_i1.p1  ORF type:complete len:572 (-),score=130.88 TRINITY_DN13580_c0_g1_i1:93-1808(-)
MASAKWLDAWTDALAGVKALSRHLVLSDIDGSGDSALLVADMQKRLRVYRGTSQVAEVPLMHMPTAIASFYQELKPSGRPIPTIAIAAGANIYLYRELLPSFMYTLPSIDPEPQEAEVWAGLRAKTIDRVKAIAALKHARELGVALSTQSLDLLALANEKEQQELIARNLETPLLQYTVVTSLGVLMKSMDDEVAVGCLVVGTEARNIMILDPTGKRVLHKVKLKSVPSMLAVSGLLDVESRVVAACRDGNLYTMKNGELISSAIELESQPVGIVIVQKLIIVGCMDQQIHAFHFRGKKAYSLYLPANICALEVLHSKARGVAAVAVALENKEIRVYNGKQLISLTKTDDVVNGLVFGRYGREDHALVMSTRGNGLAVKILPRTASLEATAVAGPPPEQDQPLDVPKKTKLYVEQTEREREHGTDMHRVFQRDLCKLRLTTARAFVKVATDTQGPISVAASATVRLLARVAGLGPSFRLRLQLTNAGTKTVSDVHVVVLFNSAVYKVQCPYVQLPLLVPGLSYECEVALTNVDPTGCADSVRVHVVSATSAIPLITAIVNMPPSELPLEGA